MPANAPKRAQEAISGAGACADTSSPKKRRKRAGISPTQRSLADLRADGWLAQVVEHRVPKINILRDLFGFIDILAVRGGEVLGVQATSGTNVAARVQKIADHEHVARVREAGIRIEVHGWRKLASGRWECRKVDLS